MARILGGIGTSHVPSIGAVYDQRRAGGGDSPGMRDLAVGRLGIDNADGLIAARPREADYAARAVLRQKAAQIDRIARSGAIGRE